MIYCDVILIVFLFVTLLLALIMNLKGKQNHNNPIPNSNLKPHCAMIIPARDESKVIEGLLRSIQKQTQPISMKDVYIIVETLDDPTIQIANHYEAQILLRTNLELKRKGYALDEGIKQILKQGNHYDLYFIMDADNILDPNYLKEMIRTYQAGYDIGIGYRNSKNGNVN